MINALFSSRESGTKSFMLDDISFGWKSIISMYEQEQERIKKGQTRMVPEVYVIRDAWTKLNVAPVCRFV